MSKLKKEFYLSLAGAVVLGMALLHNAVTDNTSPEVVEQKERKVGSEEGFGRFEVLETFYYLDISSHKKGALVRDRITHRCYITNKWMDFKGFMVETDCPNKVEEEPHL